MTPANTSTRPVSPLQEDIEQEAQNLHQPISQTVIIGKNLPPTTSESDLAFLSSKIRHVLALVDESNIPSILKDVNCPDWKRGAPLSAAIKAILPRGSKQLIDRQIPQGLLLDAKTLHDKLIVINWWLSLGKDAKTTAFEDLKRIYDRPTVSNDRHPAFGASRGDPDDGFSPIAFVGSADSQELLDEFAANSRSAPLAVQADRRKMSAMPTRVRHYMDKNVRSKIAQLEKALYGLFMMTMNTVGIIFEPMYILKRNVMTPMSKHGKTADQDMIMAVCKTIVIARNETKLRYILGDDLADSLVHDKNAVMWYYDATEGTYSENVATKRKRDQVQDADSTRRDSDHSESTVDILDVV
jgi:hypothetical protein